MRRRLLLLGFAATLTAVSFGGAFAPNAQASTCTVHCQMISCGVECCTLPDCTQHCVHVVCGGAN